MWRSNTAGRNSATIGCRHWPPISFSRKVDVIVTSGGISSTKAAKDVTSTIPIVFAGVDNPVGTGLVASLCRPGRNLTGFSVSAPDLMTKRLELLSELLTQARVFGLLVDPNNQNTQRVIR
jgi:putative tryptophan/tyrosine transport system substrate-binding protein